MQFSKKVISGTNLSFFDVPVSYTILFSGRNVTKLQFSTSTFTIGGKKAIDFFKDGSLYLIDWPGVCIYRS